MTFSFDCLLKSIDPVVASALDRALSDKDVSVEQATELFDSNGIEMNTLVLVADEASKTKCRKYCNLRHKQKHQFYKCLYQTLWLLCIQQGLSRRRGVFSTY